MEQLKRDYTKAELSEPDRAMLDYVVTITKDATQVGPRDHQRLRAAGFNDTGILQITLIASWFNYINRVADALGVGREPADLSASVSVSAANPAGGTP
ncbi:MAG: carboxymuconolactone decarboxylase family protein [Candidatus Acidiferrales bacterium]